MRFQVGDIIFNNRGRPGVVVDRDKSNDTLEVETHGERFEQASQRNMINGLAPKMRDIYSEVIDEVKGEKDPIQKIMLLTDKIEELRQDPSQYLVTRYLESQKAYIMNSNRLNPRTYVIDEDSVR